MLINGKKIANAYCLKLKEKIEDIKTTKNMIPGFAVILVGNHAPSQIYVRNKIKKAKEIGINVFEYYLDETVSQKILLAKIEHLNNNSRVHGILVQLPLPEHIDKNEVINAIDSEKDIDGFTVSNIGKLNAWQDSLVPCTAQGALLLIKDALGDDLVGKNAVVIGRSPIVGRPMYSLLLQESCTVTVLHSRSQNSQSICKTADIIVAGAGSPLLVKEDWVKPGACIIDIGFTKLNNKLYGDVDFEKVSKIAGHITPMPGGVGPMTIACLMYNTFKAMCLQKKIDLEELCL